MWKGKSLSLDGLIFALLEECHGGQFVAFLTKKKLSSVQGILKVSLT